MKGVSLAIRARKADCTARAQWTVKACVVRELGWAQAQAQGSGSGSVLRAQAQAQARGLKGQASHLLLELELGQNTPFEEDFRVSGHKISVEHLFHTHVRFGQPLHDSTEDLNRRFEPKI